MSTTAQIATIHSLKNRVGLDDNTYRAMLKNATGKASSKDLTTTEAAEIIDHLLGRAGLPGAAPRRSRNAVAGLDSPVAKKLVALWLCGWNLGVVRDRSDRAMLAFLERQTGVSHTRFLEHPADASKAIEALKAWLAREAGVKWPPEQDAIQSRLAVIDAQALRLHELGAIHGDGNLEHHKLTIAERAVGRMVSKLTHMSPAELTEVTREFGRLIRHAQGSAGKTERKRA